MARVAGSESLRTYRRKRDFAGTPEPAGAGATEPSGGPRFVVQEHHATRQHWDLRLEHDGVLASWAVPNGIPPDPHENRLAVHTEDHPLEYLEFHGDIPRGHYGAGSMTIWDRGTYELHKWEPGKVEVTFHGERLRGRYGLFPIGRGGEDKDWMIHRMDPPQDPGRVPLPAGIVPMLARPGTLPGEAAGWSFEVKWDGIRAIAYVQPGRLRLESRNLREIGDGYPELRGLLLQTSMRELVLDGEIVAFDETGRPSFSRLQRRMHVTAPAAVKRLAASTPVVYAIFDLLFCDGRSLMGRPYAERREALEALGLEGPAWRVPAAHPGQGRALLDATAAQGLEGIIAKRLDCPYEPGRRSSGWLKIKHRGRQEVVIAGWVPGEGRRAERIGALLTGVHAADGSLRYAGRVGTGFTERTLSDLADRLAPLRTPASPFAPGAPRFPRGTQFVRPELVAEVEFVEWTPDGVMRAPSFKGLRDDKPSAEVVREGEAGPFDAVEELPEGARLVRVDGRELRITNWQKVLYPQTGFTKGDLVEFYARMAPVLVPHLRDRPLTLKRYPNGVAQTHFYEKQAPVHRPDWVRTVGVGEINFTLAQDRATLVWLAGLADIELHTSLSHAADPERPTSVVFDLDPGPPAGILECGEVALVLRGLFAGLGLTSLVKTSGSKGMQVYVPLGTPTTYAQTKPFARQVAELLETRMPERVVSRMTKRIRGGKVLVDWSQNDTHKTTVNVYSVRARERPTVSTPLRWEEVEAARESGDEDALSFDTGDVLARVARDGDLFAEHLSLRQALPGGG